MTDTALRPRSTTTERRTRAGRADIQALRALAVALVVLYHAGVPGLPGGYVGVDVFFVISGFLITSHLRTQLARDGLAGLPAFYARRVRRLLPAASLVLAVTAVACRFLLPPLSTVDVADSIVAAALYVPNLLFAAQGTDYLASELPSPTLHYWSLGVEEQFYLVWPLLLLVLGSFRPARMRAGTALAGGMAAVAVVSGALCVLATSYSQPLAFFTPVTRAWEFAVGGLVSLAGLRLARLAPPLRLALRWAGIAAVLSAAVVLTEQSAFPGLLAAWPVLGCAAVIAAGADSADPDAASSPDHRLLAWAPVQRIGDWSYSLYLWHWPLLIIPAQHVMHPLPVWARVVLVVASVALAWATYTFVETPGREARFLVRRPSGLTLAAGLSASFLVVALTTALTRGLPFDARRPAPAAAAAADTDAVARFVPSDLTPSLRGSADDVPPGYTDGCQAGQRQRTVRVCVAGDLGATRSVALFGDSHSDQWWPAFQEVASEDGWRLLTVAKSSCPSVSVRVWNGQFRRPYHECDEWRAEALRRLRDAAPDVVVLSNYGTARILGTGSDEASQEAAWQAGLRTTIRELSAVGIKVLVLADTPGFETPAPVCLSGHLTSPTSCARPRRDAVDGAHTTGEREAAQQSGAAFADLTDWLCSQTDCPVVRGRYLMYRDTHHLTATYARELAGPVRDALAAAGD